MEYGSIAPKRKWTEWILVEGFGLSVPHVFQFTYKGLCIKPLQKDQERINSFLILKYRNIFFCRKIWKNFQARCLSLEKFSFEYTGYHHSVKMSFLKVFLFWSFPWRFKWGDHPKVRLRQAVLFIGPPKRLTRHLVGWAIIWWPSVAPPPRDKCSPVKCLPG